MQPVVKPVVKPVWQAVKCLYTRYNRLSIRLSNRLSNRLTTGCIVYTNIQLVVKPVPFDNRSNNRLYRVYKHRTGCKTGIQPVVKPVVKPGWQPVWQPVVSCKRGLSLTQNSGVAVLGFFVTQKMLIIECERRESLMIYDDKMRHTVLYNYYYKSCCKTFCGRSAAGWSL